jgi:hypothetical protein
MTRPHDLDRQLTAFLDMGPAELPDSSFDAVRDRIDGTRQWAYLGPWRVPTLNKLVPIGLGAAAVVAVLLIGSRFIAPPASNVAGPASSPSPSPTVSVAPPSASVTAPSAAAAGLPVGPYEIVDQGATSHPVRTTVTIPASGWNALPDFGGLLKGEDADPPEAGMLVWAFPAGTAFDVYGDPCKWSSTRPASPATTVDAFAAALAAQADRDATEPVDVTIGGYPGKSLTLYVPSNATTRTEAFKDCDQGTFASYGEAGRDPARFHQGPGQVDQLWIIDVDGAFVVIDAMSRRDTSTTLIDEMRAIAESATFE